jgi:hypothetical protein
MEYAELTQGVGLTPARKMLYYSQRLVTNPALRRLVVRGLAAGVRVRQGGTAREDVMPGEAAATLRALDRDGYTAVPRLLEEQQLADIHAFLQDKPVAEHRNPHRGFMLGQTPENVRLACYSLRDVLACPHILALANHPALLQLASSYIGCKPTISALTMRWSFARPGVGKGLQAFHRDGDDWRFIKVFFYLTDVDEESGPHVYVRGSHLTKATVRLHHYPDEEIEQRYRPEDLIKVTGPQGFGFAVDTYGIHKGLVPSKRPRLLLQIQYSLLPVYAYRYQPLAYEGLERFDPYVNRLFLKA